MAYKITRKELADWLQVDPRTITNYVRDGMPVIPNETGNPKATQYIDSGEAMQWLAFRAWDKDRTRAEANALKVLHLLERQEYANERLAKLDPPVRPPWASDAPAAGNGADAP